MIDMTAVKCVATMAAALVAGYMMLCVMDWFWGGRAVRLLKERPVHRKKARKDVAQSQSNYSDDSRFRRPGGPLPPEPSLPIFGEGQPRHTRIDNTPHVIVPRLVVEPSQTGSARDEHPLPATKIKPVTVDTPTPPDAKIAIKANKLDKSNRTIPMKRV